LVCNHCFFSSSFKEALKGNFTLAKVNNAQMHEFKIA
jgi:hypothetical protein